MWHKISETKNKCPKCGHFLEDFGFSETPYGVFNSFVCPVCFEIKKTRMELYGRPW